MPPTTILHQRNGKLKLCLVCLENEREILLNGPNMIGGTSIHRKITK